MSTAAGIMVYFFTSARCLCHSQILFSLSMSHWAWEYSVYRPVIQVCSYAALLRNIPLILLSPLGLCVPGTTGWFLRKEDKNWRCFCRNIPPVTCLVCIFCPLCANLLFKIPAKSPNKAVKLQFVYAHIWIIQTYDLCYTDLFRQRCSWGWQPAFITCYTQTGCFTALIFRRWSHQPASYLHHASQSGVEECRAGFFVTCIAQW